MKISVSVEIDPDDCTGELRFSRVEKALALIRDLAWTADVSVKWPCPVPELPDAGQPG